ncbi:hypothetical protein CLU79DRAFT_746703 [Phycomyces nitens]|nr:hypothetical protein CLU79DRAFT_746703 [Phycomyces nitens]
MSTENVTCSPSRLALARAIKTPDVGEEAEPWTKSIIFFQSHIPNKMREGMQYPHMRHQQGQPSRHQNQRPLPTPHQPQQYRGRNESGSNSSTDDHYHQNQQRSRRPGSRPVSQLMNSDQFRQESSKSLYRIRTI